MTTFLLYTLILLTYMALTLLVADVVKATWKHFNVGNEFHPEPFPLHQAFLLGVVEVCYDRPRAFHRARLAAVAAAEDRRADAIEAALLRHPASFRARQACIANHPANGTAQERPALRLVGDTSA